MAPPKKSNRKEDRTELIRSITTPLGFFVLTLLIGEPALTIVLTYSKLTEEHVWMGFIIMLVAFAIIVLIVTLFAAFNPTNLLYGKEEHAHPALDPAGTLRDDIEAIVVKSVKPECLKKSSD